jgi:hypothetical protein
VVVVRENFSMVQYLVEMGVQIDRNDNHGNSSYGLAETHGGEEILLIMEFLHHRVSVSSHMSYYHDYHFDQFVYLFPRDIEP